MTPEQMRKAIEKAYPGEKWKQRVAKMKEGQVIRVYYKFLEEKKLK